MDFLPFYLLERHHAKGPLKAEACGEMAEGRESQKRGSSSVYESAQVSTESQSYARTGKTQRTKLTFGPSMRSQLHRCVTHRSDEKTRRGASPK